ncbi:MAG: dihydrodipicolinate synthase family protein [Actinocatenispora sp.]
MTDAWHGVVVAAALPYATDPTAPGGLRPDLDAFAAHCRWLVDNGCAGVAVNGSLGEYTSLSDDERAAAVRTAVDAVGADGVVLAGVSAPGWHQSVGWAEQAAEAGVSGVFSLPPIVYRANRSELVAHFGAVAKVGLPVMIYNNPIDTKVDLPPALLAELADIDGVVAVKEFSGDVRRVREIAEQAPGLDIYAGADDVVLESLLMGAVGWFAGFPNVFPAACARLQELAVAGDLARARALYEPLVAAFRWDSRTEFVQAIKLGMDLVGRPGGPCRPPRGPLSPAQEAQVRAEVGRAVEFLDSAAGRALLAD